MIVVPLDDLARFAFVGCPSFRVRRAPEAGHILHDEQPQLIRPIQLAGFFRFDVNPGKVKPESLHQVNFVPHVLVGRIGEIPGRVKRLVQRAIQVNRLSVQRDPAVIPLPESGGADFSNAEICGDRVFLGGNRQPQFPLIQVRRFRTPQPGLRHLKREVDLILACDQRQFFRMLYGPVLKPQGELSRRSFLGYDAGRHFNLAVETRVELRILHVGLRPRFQPDRLPNAANLAVPLLAACLIVSVCILRANQDRILPLRVPTVRHFKLEIAISASVRSGMETVDPNVALIIHGPKMEENPRPGRFRPPDDGSPVPADAGFVVTNAGQRARPGKRHLDPFRKILCFSILPGRAGPYGDRLELERPGPVQIKPIRTLPIRPGMLRAWNCGRSGR
ncbi:hypothetical protein D3C76_677800 [compost metagenome]